VFLHSVIFGVGGGFHNFAVTYDNRDRRFPDPQRVVETSVARYRMCAGTRWNKSFGFHDSNKRWKADGSWEIGRERERERKLSFPRRSITRRHYFLPGRRYKWCSTIRERPIDILSTGSRMRYAKAPKSAAFTATESERGLSSSHAEEKFPKAHKRAELLSGRAKKRRVYSCEQREDEESRFRERWHFAKYLRLNTALHLERFRDIPYLEYKSRQKVLNIENFSKNFKKERGFCR